MEGSRCKICNSAISSPTATCPRCAQTPPPLMASRASPTPTRIKYRQPWFLFGALGLGTAVLFLGFTDVPVTICSFIGRHRPFRNDSLLILIGGLLAWGSLLMLFGLLDSFLFRAKTPSRGSEPLKKGFLFPYGLAVASVFIWSASFAFRSNRPQGLDKTTLQNGTMQMLVSSDGRCQLQAPVEWRPVAEPPPGCCLNEMDPTASSGLFVFWEDKRDFTNMTLDRYSTIILSQLRVGLTDVELTDLEQREIPPQPAKFVRLEGAIDGVNLVMLIAFVETSRGFYQVRIPVKKSMYADHGNSLWSIANSFRELP